MIIVNERSEHYTIPAYKGFDAVKFNITKDWHINPYDSKNWSHHFMSLRWLSEKITSTNEKDRMIAWNLIKSFIKYHLTSRRINTHYTNEHTVAERIKFLLHAISTLDDVLNHEDKVFLKDYLRQLVDLCLSGEAYLENHNHGLMVDEALVLCSIKLDLLSEDELMFVYQRIEKQIAAIFTKNGITKEHSVSYQEYNLSIILRLLQLLSNAKLDINENLILKLTDIFSKRTRISNLCYAAKWYVP